MTQTKNTLNELILKINENNIFIKSPDESDITYGELISYMKDTYSKLSSIKIPLPPIEEQQEIVKIINKKFNEIKSFQSMIDALILKQKLIMLIY